MYYRYTYALQVIQVHTVCHRGVYVCRAVHMSGIEDLLLYLASSDDERQFAFHVLQVHLCTTGNTGVYSVSQMCVCVCRAVHVSGIEDLLLYLASSDDERQFAFHVLEIISLMFREQVARLLHCR